MTVKALSFWITASFLFKETKTTFNVTDDGYFTVNGSSVHMDIKKVH